MYTICFDGLYREAVLGKPGAERSIGFMCTGWLIYKNGMLIAHGHGGFIHRYWSSSNGAEYLALIDGLEAALDLGIKHEPILIEGDSRSVIDQMQGLASVSSPRIVDLYHRARSLAQRFRTVEWHWVPRRDNRAADHLTRRALRQVFYQEQTQYSKETSGWGEKKIPNGFYNILDLQVIKPLSVP